MRRILFVDDESGILFGLKNLLRKQRHRWEMVFAEGAEAALELLDASPFDVIVSDMRMPGMDGPELLGRVKERHPHVVRLILSGHADREAIQRALPVAHQFVAKPCEADSIPKVIDRILDLRARVEDPNLAALVASLDKLPSTPSNHRRIRDALADPKTSTAELIAALANDPAVSAKMLHLVNAGYFSNAAGFTKISQAVSFLGAELVRDLFRSGDLLECDERAAASDGRGELVHEVGRIVVTKLSERSESSEAHVHAGAYLLGLWGLPASLVEEVTRPSPAALPPARSAAPTRTSCETHHPQ
jgi:DNA-binding NarL/FixJ family response regulator